jgi:hypothetical protein
MCGETCDNNAIMSAAERRAAVSEQIAQYQHHQQQYLQEIQVALHNATQVLHSGAGWHAQGSCNCFLTHVYGPAGGSTRRSTGYTYGIRGGADRNTDAAVQNTGIWYAVGSFGALGL